MRIGKLYANNIKGFDNFEVECGDVNVAAGTNGSNKTSMLTLVTALFGDPGGKTNARILRADSDSGEIGAVIESDDRGENWEICREFKPGKVETPTIRSSITGKVGSPVAWLKPLIDKISIEPISRAMNAGEDEQTQILLSTIPMAVEPADLATAVGAVDVPGLKAHVANASRMSSGLDAIAACHKLIYDHRRDVNRDVKVKETHAAELLDSIPKSAGEDVDWSARAKVLQSDKDTAMRAQAAEEAEAERALASVKEKVRQDRQKIFDSLKEKCQQDQAAVDADIDARIKALEDERSNRLANLTESLNSNLEVERGGLASDIEKVTAAYQTGLQDIGTRCRPEIDKITEDLGAAQRSAEDQAGHANTRSIAAKNTKEADVLQAKSDAMTAALDRLDHLKTALLGRLDKEIPGLRVENGIISINGVALSEVNTAERAKFWLQIAVRRAGDLGIVVMDGAECFDPIQFPQICKAALATGCQFFFGRVDGEPFRIERINAGDLP